MYVRACVRACVRVCVFTNKLHTLSSKMSLFTHGWEIDMSHYFKCHLYDMICIFEDFFLTVMKDKRGNCLLTSANIALKCRDKLWQHAAFLCACSSACTCVCYSVSLSGCLCI